MVWLHSYYPITILYPSFYSNTPSLALHYWSMVFSCSNWYSYWLHLRIPCVLLGEADPPTSDGYKWPWRCPFNTLYLVIHNHWILFNYPDSFKRCPTRASTRILGLPAGSDHYVLNTIEGRISVKCGPLLYYFSHLNEKCKSMILTSSWKDLEPDERG